MTIALYLFDVFKVFIVKGYSVMNFFFEFGIFVV